eukprot:3653229-Prymnesium_polylepis.1
MRACSVKRSIQRRRGAYHFRCAAFDPNLGALRMHPTGDLQHVRGMVRRCGNVRGMASAEAVGVRHAALDDTLCSGTVHKTMYDTLCSGTVHKTMWLSHPVRSEAAAPDRHPFSSGGRASVAPPAPRPWRARWDRSRSGSPDLF